MANKVKIIKNDKNLIFDFSEIDFDLFKNTIKNAFKETFGRNLILRTFLDREDENQITVKIQNKEIFEDNFLNILKKLVIAQNIDVDLNGQLITKKDFVKNGIETIQKELNNFWKDKNIEMLKNKVAEEIKQDKEEYEKEKKTKKYNENFDYEDIKQRHEKGIFLTKDPIIEDNEKVYSFWDLMRTSDYDLLKRVYLENFKEKINIDEEMLLEIPEAFPEKKQVLNKKINFILKSILENPTFKEKMKTDPDILKLQKEYQNKLAEKGLLFLMFSEKYNRNADFKDNTPILPENGKLIRFKDFKQFDKEKQKEIILKLTDMFEQQIKKYNKGKTVFSKRGELARVFVKNLAFEINASVEEQDKIIETVHKRLTSALKEVNKNIEKIIIEK